MAVAFGGLFGWVWFGSLPAQVLMPATAGEPVLVDRMGQSLGPGRSAVAEGDINAPSLAVRAFPPSDRAITVNPDSRGVVPYSIA